MFLTGGMGEGSREQSSLSEQQIKSPEMEVCVECFRNSKKVSMDKTEE